MSNLLYVHSLGFTFLLETKRTFQVTNSISQSRHNCPKLVQIDTSPTIAESIRRTHNGESISLLFGDWPQTVGHMNGTYDRY